MSALKRVETIESGCCFCHSKSASSVCRTLDFCYETCSNEFDYVACDDCGHVYLRNRPTLDELGTIYPSNYLAYQYEEQLGSFINEVRNWVQRGKVSPIRKYAQHGDFIVDVGSGAGDLLDIVRRFGDPSWELVGVDFSEAAIHGLEQRGFRSISERFEECDWPFERSAGVIVMNQLIEHLEDPRIALRKARELLRPGGALIIETPALEGQDARIFRDRYWGQWHAPRHWNVFSAKSLSAAAEQAGLKVLSVEYIVCPFSWLHSLQYMLRDRWGWERLGRWFDVDHFVPLVAATGLDLIQRAFTSRTSNMRVVAQHP